MKNLTTVGRILFAVPFFIIGINHFIMKDWFEAMLTSFIPGGVYTILLIGTIMILGSILIAANKFVRIVCYVFAILLFAFISTIHIPGFINSTGNEQNIHLINLLKDIGLMGGAIIIAGTYPNK